MEFNVKNAFDVYCKNAYTNRLACGVIFDKKVYVVLLEDNELDERFLKIDQSSDAEHRGQTLRFAFQGKGSKANMERKIFMRKGAIELGTVEDLGNKNKGDRFEEMVAKWFGVQWENDKAPFWERGDVVDKLGRHWLVKLETGTFLTEKTFNDLQG